MPPGFSCCLKEAAGSFSSRSARPFVGAGRSLRPTSFYRLVGAGRQPKLSMHLCRAGAPTPADRNRGKRKDPCLHLEKQEFQTEERIRVEKQKPHQSGPVLEGERG